MEIIIHLLIAFFIGLLGYLIKYKKMHQLIAGLNDYHPVKNDYSDKYNIQQVGNVMGNACFLYVLAIILSIVLNVDDIWIHLIATASMFIYIGINYASFKK
ncbi:DUF3784 domain-containing protein [Weeksellaceae bacterium KMM 9724]|uniref:DUF3784 domain-containing protein n=1 Tax=Profundicola chukchiensis TaxID=2961959 RepID=UPI00243AC54F|nr:DUF3784 domain-containing protein [Profundicola chukchiensis]MDG4950949.1 DUF3784 domain-containing protein [Profundicola chukchiensis]